MSKVKGFLKKHLGDLVVGLLLFASSCALLGYYLFPRTDSGEVFANVYHQNEVIYEKISLKGEDKEYPVKIENGDVSINMIVELKDHKIGIKESNCSNQYCVHQGYTNSPMQTLICAPNEVRVSLYSLKATHDSEIEI